MLWPVLLKLKSHDPETRRQAVRQLAEMETDRALEVLLKTAEEERDQKVRSAAIVGIGMFPSDKATAFLLRKLQEPSVETRQAAVEGLRDKMEEQVTAALVKALRDPDAGVRGRAVQTLDRQRWHPKNPEEELWHGVARGGFLEVASSHQADAIEPLQTVLRTADTTMQVLVIRALGEIKSERVIDALLPSLKSTDRGVCVAAIEILREFKNPKLAEPLIAQLRHSDHRVRVAAIEAAAYLQLQQTAPTLVPMLKDSSWDVRSAAAVALGKIGNSEAAESLVAVARNDADPQVRLGAIASLGRVGGPAAIRPLVLLLVDAEANVRHAAIAALEVLNPKWAQTEEARHAAPDLRAACDSGDPAVHYAAVNVLQQLGERSLPQTEPDTPRAMAAAGYKQRIAFSVFTELLGDPHRDLRLAAAHMLGRLGDPRALASLQTALTDADESIRTAAAQSIKLLQTRQTKPDSPAANSGQQTGSPAPPDQPGAVDGLQEIVLCADDGQVLGEWPSPSETARGRVSLFDPVLKSSDALAETLSLGRPGRLEVETANGRLVLVLQANRRLFVRSSGRSPRT